MEQETLRRFPTNDRKILAICIALVGVISPLYIDSRKKRPLEEESINFLPYLPLLLLITVMMSISFSHQLARFSPCDHKLLGILVTIVAIVSPLYIDRRKMADIEVEEQGISSYLPLLMLFLIIAIAISCYLDHSFTGFDPYWIYRVGGSSTGLLILLLLLAFILNFKAL